MGPGKRRNTYGAAAFVWLLFASAALAGDVEPVRRHVIALHDGALAAGSYTVDPVHALLEMPLNHLGCVVWRHDIRSGPPPEEWFADARAIVTAFDHTEKPCPWLLPWLERAADEHDLRFVHFGDFGPMLLDDKGKTDPGALAHWLARFGVGYSDFYAEDPGFLEIERFDDKATAYEASPMGNTIHRGPWSVSKKNKIWIKTRSKSDPRERHPVLTGPWGGIALDPWTLYRGRGEGDRRWYLDPFLFFRETLGLEGIPAPHPSVLNGRRMFFLHVDGDGFESLSTVKPGAYAAEVLHERVFERYQLPYTVSIIVRSLTDDYLVPDVTDRMKLAQRILNDPRIEPASHGVLHTLRWRRPLTPNSPPRTIMWYAGIKNYEYSPVAEVRDSIRFINERLLTHGRKCAVMLWTGYANPFEDAVQQSVDSGCWNLNGGVFRWDVLHNSVGFVSPWGRVQGKTIQIYAGTANENDFEGFFDTMPGAYRAIDQSIERTGKDCILKPANIYIHFYSAETPLRLRAVHYLVRRWAFQRETAPVFASTYAKAVHSAISGAHIFKTGEGWRFSDFGDCRTVRIDGEDRDVDWRASEGLLGARRIGESLYLHLARPDAKVALAHAPPPHPYIGQANHILRDVRLTEHGVAFRSKAHSRREVHIRDLPKSAVVLKFLDGKKSTARTDEEGRLILVLDQPGDTFVEIRTP